VVDAGEGTVQTVEARIDDIVTDGDEEFACLADGSRIRLDRIQRVDDVDRSGAC
jgi:hypothetical protein